MRFVIFGAGAIGGAVGARLHQSGHAVTLIARGAHLEAIRRDGLTFLTPVERVVLPLPAVGDPGDVDWTRRRGGAAGHQEPGHAGRAHRAARRRRQRGARRLPPERGGERARGAAAHGRGLRGGGHAPRGAPRAGCDRGLRRRDDRPHRRRPLSRGRRRALRGDLRGAGRLAAGLPRRRRRDAPQVRQAAAQPRPTPSAPCSRPPSGGASCPSWSRRRAGRCSTPPA